MTVEVRELTINAIVVNDPDRCPDEKKGCESGACRGGLSEYEREEIVSACADQVLKIIKETMER